MAGCQVDFYLLASPEGDAGHLACKLALMALERGHRIDILAADADSARALDELMWRYPEGRFIPHDLADGPTGRQAPVRIHQRAPDKADVLINLTQQPVDQPQRCRRLLEIVPHRDADRKASRDKFRAYRAQGLEPATHPIQ